MTIGGDSAQHHVPIDIDGMHEDAVEVIARLFGRDGKLRLVDELLEIAGHQRESMREIADVEGRKVAFRQRLKIEARAARPQQKLTVFSRRFERDLRAFRQFADDVEKHMSGERRGTRLADVGLDFLGHFEIEIGRLQNQSPRARLQQHIGQNRDRIAAFYDAVNVAERLLKRRPLDRDFHSRTH